MTEPAMTADLRFELQDVTDWVTALLRAAGYAGRSADLVARHLVRAQASGHRTHGLVLLPSVCEAGTSGTVRSAQAPVAVIEQPGFRLIDATGCAGMVVLEDAMEAACLAVRQHGIGLVGVRNASHIGRLGHYGEIAARHGLTAVMMANTVGRAARARPVGAREGRVSSNPLCFVWPYGDHGPVVLDFATTAITLGAARLAQLNEQPLPPDSLVGPDGSPSLDPVTALLPPLGALLPFGGHKAAGLGLMCELMGAALLGGDSASAAVDSRPPGRPRTVNSVVAWLFDPARLGDAQTQARMTADILDWHRSAGDAGSVFYPGERAEARRAHAAGDGLVVDAAVWRWLLTVAGRIAPGTRAPEPLGQIT